MSKNDKFCNSLCVIGVISTFIYMVAYFFGWQDAKYFAIGGILTILLGFFNYEP